MLAIVAEQTGYPEDLLDMDLDLEADLGIDTVKQAEVFATIREAYGIERDDSLKLRDYPTLNRVVGFVHERTPQAAPRRAARAEPEPATETERRRRRPTSRAASPCPSCGRRSTAAPRPASRWARAAGCSSCPTAAASPPRSPSGSRSSASRS